MRGSRQTYVEKAHRFPPGGLFFGRGRARERAREDLPEPGPPDADGQGSGSGAGNAALRGKKGRSPPRDGFAAFNRRLGRGGLIRIASYYIRMSQNVQHPPSSAGYAKRTAPDGTVLISGRKRLHGTGNLPGTQAAGAGVDPFRGTIHNSLDAIDVGLPSAVGTSV